MTRSGAQNAVIGELRALRRCAEGVSTEAITLAPTICELLGGGDPYVAYTRLQQLLLDQVDDRAINAAAATLGFSSSGRSVLARLEDYAGQAHLDQRHVRRLSDEGIEKLAVLIATHWTVEAVPTLDVLILRTRGGIALMLHGQHPSSIEMNEARVSIFKGEEVSVPAIEWRQRAADAYIARQLTRPLNIEIANIETSVSIVWRGELWPKFNCHLVDQPPVNAIESLGNKIMIRTVPAAG